MLPNIFCQLYNKNKYNLDIMIKGNIVNSPSKNSFISCQIAKISLF